MYVYQVYSIYLQFTVTIKQNIDVLTYPTQLTLKCISTQKPETIGWVLLPGFYVNVFNRYGGNTSISSLRRLFIQSYFLFVFLYRSLYIQTLTKTLVNAGQLRFAAPRRVLLNDYASHSSEKHANDSKYSTKCLRALLEKFVKLSFRAENFDKIPDQKTLGFIWCRLTVINGTRFTSSIIRLSQRDYI